jgi:hypothetical protein
MVQARNDPTQNVVELKPLTDAERARNYRLRKQSRKRRRRSVTKTVTRDAAKTVMAPTPPVTIIELKREIAEWIRLYNRVDKLVAAEPRSDRPIQMVLLAIGAGFFALIAYAAVN